MMKNSMLEVKNLSKKWKDFSLNNISFSLPEGYILGLVGKNGAGKSTLINCLIGANDYEGEVRVNDRCNSLHEREASKQIGFIIEDGPFIKRESLLYNGEIFGKLYPNFDRMKFQNYLTRFGLCENMEYCQLSKGMETKFQLAFSLAHSPKLLILDEATAGLDPVFRRNFLQILQNEVCENKISIIISTHLTTDLDKVADYIMLLDNGEMVFYEDKETLLDKYPLVSGQIEVLKEIPEHIYKRIVKKGNIFHTIFTDTDYFEKHPDLLENLQVKRTSLEEIMYYLSTPSI